LGGQAAVEVHCLLRGLQGLRPPAHFGKPDAQVVEAAGQVGEEGVGVLGGQPAADLHRLLRGFQGLRPPAHFGKPVAQVVEAGARSGRKASGCWAASRRRRSHRLLRGFQGLLPPAQCGKGKAQVVQNPRPLFVLLPRRLRQPDPVEIGQEGPQDQGAVRGWERPVPRPKPGRGHLLRKNLNRLLQPAGRRLQRSPRRLRSAGDGRSAEPGQHLPDHIHHHIPARSRSLIHRAAPGRAPRRAPIPPPGGGSPERPSRSPPGPAGWTPPDGPDPRRSGPAPRPPEDAARWAEDATPPRRQGREPSGAPPARRGPAAPPGPSAFGRGNGPPTRRPPPPAP
jgi:hypothetical protein